MPPIKKAIKSILPAAIVQAIRRHRAKRDEIRLKRICAEYDGLTTREVFTKIYEDGVWGVSKDPSDRYFSGLGSRDEITARTYVEAVHRFLSSFESKPDVADLGCGDFSIGSKVRALCGRYTACDIVQPLIDANKERYKSQAVDFRVLDLTQEDPPKADIVFIRQVLQHLSNDDIRKALPKIERSYKYLVLTEHLPGTDDFTPNLDKPAGPTTRLRHNSGIVLTSPPFNLAPKEQRVLCQVAGDGAVIKTTLYTLS